MDFVNEQRIIEFLRENPSLILLMRDEAMTMRIWDHCLRWQPKLFEYMPTKFNALAELAVALNAENLLLCESKGIEITNSLIITAIKRMPLIVLYLDEKYLNDELFEMACEVDNSLIGKLPLKDEFILSMISENPTLIGYLKEQTYTQMITAISSSKSADIRNYLRNPSSEVLSFLEERFINV